MSITESIQGIIDAKNDLVARMVSAGYTVDESTKLRDLVQMLEFGLDTSDATAVPSTILKGYTAYVRGQKITGTYVPPGESESGVDLTAFTSVVYALRDTTAMTWDTTLMPCGGTVILAGENDMDYSTFDVAILPEILSGKAKAK